MIADIDAAIKSRLSGIMVTGPSGPVAVPVVIKHPEEEFKDVVFPCIAVSLQDMVYQPERQYQEKVVRNITGTEADVYAPSVPYGLVYQVMSLAQFQIQDREMSAKIASKFPAPQSSLSVNGHALSVMYNGYAVADSPGVGGKRVFKKVTTFTIETELDDVQFTAYKKVLTVDLAVHPGLTVLP